MIIWINGTFGSGKTTTAYELQKRLPHSFVYDPERFGYVLKANIPKEMAKGDFQDYPLWREANYKLLKQIANDYQGTIIVPMTVTNEFYFDEMIGRLKKDGIEVRHFTLAASKKTIQQRLQKRFEGKHSWAYNQIDHRISCLEKDVFKEHIKTDQMTIEEVVETIATLSEIQLQPDHRTKVRKIIDRFAVTVREIQRFK
ncbi:AAA family ATPase [Metabacillus sp. Hm71]|uniref:AAA family ATPase n=1 Tax=Metabacillus sp. Hm71 TaxID=3450743 RepID=UPI003F43D29C